MSVQVDVGPVLGERFDDALVFAARTHRAQRRKGSGIPYVGHLLGVCSLVIEDGGGEDEAIAALLHDAAEDQGGEAMLAEIRSQFGDSVADIVAACSDTFETPKPAWRQRKEDYVRHLATAPEPVRRVSLADKLFNARAILRDYLIVGDELWSRFSDQSGGATGQLWYYRQFADQFLALQPGPMARGLDETVTELERLVAVTERSGVLGPGRCEARGLALMGAQKRVRGAMLGMACGDALGTTLEFRAPGTFAPIDDIVGGGPFRLRAGEWTDDTSMALCLAESLIEREGWDPTDQLERYVRWWQDGHLSSNGRCFDVGVQTREALAAFQRTSACSPMPVDPEKAGNGSIMRLAPVPIAYSADIEAAISYSGERSLTTHPAQRPVDGCRYLGSLIAAAVSGTPKDELLDEQFWRWGDLHPEIARVAGGSFRRKQPPEIKGSGYVVSSLEAALWALSSSDSFRDGALLAVNLGDDADTTGAVYGQIAGAIYGEDAIPDGWLAVLAHRDQISHFADRLEELAL